MINLLQRWTRKMEVRCRLVGVPELQHPVLYHTMLKRAAARKPKPYDGEQVLGMKAK